MMVWVGAGAARVGTTVVAAFLASLVECVEALTVVLAVGACGDGRVHWLDAEQRLQCWRQWWLRWGRR